MLAERVEQWKKQLLEEGMQQGMQKGMQQGKLEGIQEGVQKGLATLLIRQLTLKFGPLTSEQREQIESADEDTLLAWSEKILTAASLSAVIDDESRSP